MKIQYSPNLLLEKAFSLIRDRQFDSLRVWVAQMLGIQLSNSSYNLLGYEGQIVQLLCKKFALCSDSYKIVFQCWGCCYESEKIINLTSLTTFNSNCQSSINNKIDSSLNCLKCRDPCANIEPKLFKFTELLPLLIMEVGHLNEVVRVQDISDSVSIVHKDKRLYYSLIGFTIHVGIHFCMRVKMEGGWYSYDGMERPKLTKLKEKLATFIGRVNCIFYVLTTISRV